MLYIFMADADITSLSFLIRRGHRERPILNGVAVQFFCEKVATATFGVSCYPFGRGIDVTAEFGVHFLQ